MRKWAGKANEWGLIGCHLAKPAMNYQLRRYSTSPVSSPTTNEVWIEHLDPNSYKILVYMKTELYYKLLLKA